MKYLVFTIALLGVPPLTFLLHLNQRWLKYIFWLMVMAMCLYISTSINFFSNETYRGSARGMEVSFIHLLSIAVLGELLLRWKVRHILPEWGYRIYFIYFLLCLPSLGQAADLLISWYEIWKMIMLYLFYLAVYSYLNTTNDLKTVLGGLAAFAIVNMLMVVKNHLEGAYQPHGVFPHQNCMAVAMHLFGALFFARYLLVGMHTGFDKLCTAGFLCAAAATLRSYSRVAIVLMAVTYGSTAIACMGAGHPFRTLKRTIPLVILGTVCFGALLPRVIERFKNAPEASGTTRLELAGTAMEMIKAEPWTGVGINNWGIKVNLPYEYALRAGRKTNRGEDFKDGVVETVYLLVGAECGIPALVAMVAWFLWYWVSCLRLMRKLKGTRWYFIPAGLFGGLTAVYAQSAFEWVLRQQLNLICIMFMYAMLSYLNTTWRKLRISEMPEGMKPNA